MTLCRLFAMVCCVCVAIGCDDRASKPGSFADVENERQWKEYERQQEVGAKQLEESQRQSDVSAKQQEHNQRQLEAFDKLLERWTEQADRQDRILDAQERKLLPQNQ